MKTPVPSTAPSNRARWPLLAMASQADTFADLADLAKKFAIFQKIAGSDKADLHVHLTGSGDVGFWISELRKCAAERSEERSEDELARELRLDKPLTDFSVLDDERNLEDKGFQNFEEFQAKFFGLRGKILKSDGILTRLIIHCAEKYSQEKVKYVEFSYHASALIHNKEQLKIGVQEAEKKGVTVRFLAAFSRVPKIKNKDKVLKELKQFITDKISNGIRIEELKNELADPKNPAAEKIRCQFKKVLKKLEETFSENGDSDLASIIVGLDLMGDETQSMYIPFIWEEFLAFRIKASARHPRFGFRIHAGEGIDVEKEEGFVSMLAAGICCHTLLNNNIPVRIGHGVAIPQFIDSFKMLYHEEGIALEDAEKFAKDLFCRVPIEVCMISNHMLLGDVTSLRNRSSMEPYFHAVKLLLLHKFNVVLGTDDHGIFDAMSFLKEELDRSNVKNDCTFADHFEKQSFADVHQIHHFKKQYQEMITKCKDSLILKEVALAIFVAHMDPKEVRQISTTGHEYSFMTK